MTVATSSQTFQTSSKDVPYIGNIKTVTFPSLEITLPRDNRYYSVPILVEGDYRGSDLKNNQGYFILSGLAYESDNPLGGATRTIPVTESTKEDDKWASLMYFEFACNSNGRTHMRESRRTHKKLDLRIQFLNPMDGEKYFRDKVWKGVNVVCATTAEMPEKESKYLVPYTSATAPETK